MEYILLLIFVITVVSNIILLRQKLNVEQIYFNLGFWFITYLGVFLLEINNKSFITTDDFIEDRFYSLIITSMYIIVSFFALLFLSIDFKRNNKTLYEKYYITFKLIRYGLLSMFITLIVVILFDFFN